MARQVKQTLPQPPAVYDQEYIARLANAINSYMFQAQALGEVVAGRFIMTDQVTTTVGAVVGTLYLVEYPAGSGQHFLSVVKATDP
jgi:hypothetical protein